MVSQKLLEDDETHGIWLDACGTMGVLRFDMRRAIGGSSAFQYISKLPDGVYPATHSYPTDIGYYGLLSSGAGTVVGCYVRGDDGRIALQTNSTVNQISGSLAFPLYQG